MMFWRILLVFALSAPLACAADLATLFQRLKEVANAEPGIDKAEQNATEQVQAVGAAAIPGLLALLKDGEPAVRTLAAHTLRDIEGLEEKHLDDLITACRRGERWLPPAIARVGTAKAAKFLAEEFVRTRETYGQLDWSIEILGEKSVSHLVNALKSEKTWDQSLDMAVTHIFGRLGPKAKGGVAALSAMANDANCSEAARAGAISAIGAIGHTAVEAVPFLERVRMEKNEVLRKAAEDALIGIGSPEGVAILFQRFEKDPNEGYLLGIAELRHRARILGPKLLPYLRHGDWDIRLATARALGFIGHEDAAEALVAALASKEDWRIVWAAAESLGRLKSADSSPALARIANDHWYAPVRKSAATALKAIGGATPYKRKGEPNFSFEFYAHWQLDTGWIRLEEPEIARIRFPAADPQSVTVDVPVVHEGRPGTDRFTGIRVEDGQIVGSDHGEWGGKLLFVDRAGKARVLAPVNTHAIYNVKGGCIALTGLAHLGINDGLAYKLERTAQGHWNARKWRVLPGAPRYSRLLRDGTVLAECVGGAVLIAQDGTMKALTREELLRP